MAKRHLLHFHMTFIDVNHSWSLARSVKTRGYLILLSSSWAQKSCRYRLSQWLRQSKSEWRLSLNTWVGWISDLAAKSRSEISRPILECLDLIPSSGPQTQLPAIDTGDLLSVASFSLASLSQCRHLGNEPADKICCLCHSLLAPSVSSL